MPPPIGSTVDEPDYPEALPYMGWWVRGILAALAVLLTSVFGIAAYLNPYREDGSARTMETHRQLGLPPCTFKLATGGLPCPSCGMTTSFALLIHGDPINSLRANWVGTLLASFGVLMIPWCLGSVVLRRPVLIGSVERALSWTVFTFLSLMMVRWVVVIALTLWERRAS